MNKNKHFQKMVTSPTMQKRAWACVCYLDEPLTPLLALGADRGFMFLHDRDTYEADGSHFEMLPNGETEEVQHKAGDLKKPHWHIYAHFPHGVRAGTLADALHIGCNQIPDRPIKVPALVRYYTHVDQPDKAEYSADELLKFGDWTGHEKELLIDRASEGRMMAGAILRQIEEQTSNGDYSIATLVDWALSHDCWSEYKSAQSTWKDLLRERREQNQAQYERIAEEDRHFSRRCAEALRHGIERVNREADTGPLYGDDYPDEWDASARAGSPGGEM